MTEEQWFTNKQLYEMFMDLKIQMSKTSAELAQTREIISRYNGLREKMESCADRISVIENTTETKQNVGKNVQGWTGWLVAVISLMIALWKVAG